jgi:tetratricopeptide (TPR) repeat protein
MVGLPNPTRFLSRKQLAQLSAVAKRQSQRFTQKRTGIFQPIVGIWKLLGAIILSLAGFVAFAIILLLLWKAVQPTIVITTISIPKVLADNGYTSDVAAQRLRDAIQEITKEAQNIDKPTEVELQVDLPNISVPAVGLPLEIFSDQIRNILPGTRRWKVDGELTFVRNRLSLRLRVNGRDIFEKEAEDPDPERAGDLFAAAAQSVLELSYPLTVASYLVDRDPPRSLIIAREVVNDHKSELSLVFNAHVVIIRVLTNQGKLDEAIAEAQKAIEANKYFGHLNRGEGLRAQFRTEEAISEYQRAINLVPKAPEI